MLSTHSARLAPLAAAVPISIILAACGGGGGGSGGTSPPPSPPPPPSDTTAPDTTLTSTPSAISNHATASFAATSSESGGTFEFSVDNSVYATATSPFALSGLSDGSHTFSVRARDAAGNVDATPASFTWTIDSTAPVAELRFPSQGHTDATSITLRGTAQETGTISSMSVGGVAVTATSANYANWSVQLPLSQGLNSFDLVTTDNAGNTRTQAAISRITRGFHLATAGAIQFDAVRNRLLLEDRSTRSLVAVYQASGFTSSRVSTPSLGGSDVDGLSHLEMPAAGDTIFSARPYADELVAIDLVTGSYRVVSPPSPQQETSLGYQKVACNLPCTTIYAMSESSSFNDARLFAIDTTTGARTAIPFNSQGHPVAYPRGLVFDTSGTVAYPRVLFQLGPVPQWGLQYVVYEINLQTGSFGVVSQLNVRGTGPALGPIRDMRVDAARGQLIVLDCIDTATYCAGRFLAIDLLTGNRSVIAESTAEIPLNGSWSFALDSAPGNERLYFTVADNLQLARLDFTAPTRPLSIVHDVAVGTGTRLSGGGGLIVHRSGAAVSLLTTTRTPSGGLVRVDPHTGNRTLVSATGGPGSGATLYGPLDIRLDTRAGAPSRVLLLQGADASGNEHIVGVDLATGDRTELMPPNIPLWSIDRFVLDASANRVLTGITDWSMSNHSVTGYDLPSGSPTVISGGGMGGGLPFTYLTDVGIDDRAGAPRRYLAIDAGYQMLAIDPATGLRTLVTGDGAMTGPRLDNAQNLVVDSAGRQAFVVNSSQGALLRIELDTGNRSLVAGSATDGTSRGTGPGLRYQVRAMDFDPVAGMVYCLLNNREIMAVDVASGDRILISR